MFDFEFTKVRAFDGTNRNEPAVEVFNTATGETVAVVRRAVEENESRSDWVARAFRQAQAA